MHMHTCACLWMADFFFPSFFHPVPVAFFFTPLLRIGHCLVLVAPHEQKLYSRICGVLGYANGFMGMPLELTRMSHHFSRAVSVIIEI